MTNRLVPLLASLLLLVLLTMAAFAQPGPPQPDFTVTAAERTQVIDGSIAALNRYYVFPDIAKKMEQALRARVAKGEYDTVSSARALADKLRTDLREVSKDKHLGVSYN